MTVKKHAGLKTEWARESLHTGSLHGSAFEVAAIPMLVVCADGAIVATNCAWRKLSASCVPAADAAQTHNDADDPILTSLPCPWPCVDGSAPQLDFVLASREGTRPMRAHITPFRAPDVDQDLTMVVLHELQEDLDTRNKYHQLRAVIDNAPVLIFVKDLDHRMVISNRETTRIFGLREGHPDKENLTPEDATSVHVLDDEVATGDGPRRIEESLMTTEGLRHFSTVKFPLRDAAGAVTAVGGIAQDVTEKILVEHENARLQVSEKAAREADRVKSEFLATMSHEIRTPLAGIIGLTNLLRENCKNDHDRHHLDSVHGASTMLLRILNDVLDFSKLEANKFTLEAASFDLGALIEATCATLRGAASAKGLRMDVQLDAAMPRYVVGDAGRIAQVLNNFLNNAIKFSSRGAISVAAHCSTSSAAADAVKLRIKVVDEGIGIRAEDMNKLFSAFSQADSSIARRFGGTGLGLAISKGIVESMGGSVRAESVQGKGSTFSFEVPIKLFGLVFDNRSGKDERLVGQLQGRILVAEDNAINQTVILHQLKKLGLCVALANDGAAAYQLACDEDFDVILMDCHMPGMDGFEATKRIRALRDPARSCIPIVALTANALAGERQRCLDGDMTDYLTKPVRLEHLYACLLQYLDAK